MGRCVPLKCCAVAIIKFLFFFLPTIAVVSRSVPLAENYVQGHAPPSTRRRISDNLAVFSDRENGKIGGYACASSVKLSPPTGQ